MEQIKVVDRIPTGPFDEDTLQPFVLSMTPLAKAYIASNVTKSQYTPAELTVAAVPSSGGTIVSLLIQSMGISVDQIHGSSQKEAMIIVVYRDPRDCICSLAKRFHPRQDNALELAYPIVVPSIRVVLDYKQEGIAKFIHYEQYLPSRLANLVDKLGELLDVSFTAEFRSYLAWEFSLSRVKARTMRLNGFDQYDQFGIHGMHITNDGQAGIWREEFTPGFYDVIKDGLDEFLVTFGYESDVSWRLA